MSDINAIKKISMNELLINNGEEGKPLWVMIHEKIYDLTDFKHPGGRDVLENDDPESYTDKGREFDSVGHPPSAINDMKQYLIGELDKTVKQPDKVIKGKVNKDESKKEGGFNIALIFLIIAGLVLAVAYTYGKN